MFRILACHYLTFEGDFMNLLKALFYSLVFVGFVNAAEPAALLSATPSALTNINTANTATLTGTGVKGIIKYCQANKGFKTIEELGIGNVHGTNTTNSIM
jgi:DNA uptake protein ComE-like DNA-binding protein